ncbi:MAG: DNA polymerase III subunit gamma/tau [Clostridiales bacterium]|nr:DNA polymerase III subunit gamma/tau [Clostridiales bacterium]
MYIALYRSERPEVFNEILGQEHIVKILKNQVAKGTVSQAYLFTGTRGTGKTSTARILAKAVNCLEDDKPCGKCENCLAIKDGKFLDVIELDAASNNGVEDIRRLRETVNYPPSVGRMKVYIIDEVHMLSTGAENALLKTLEEPPENVLFILATTDPQKVSATIRSRCVTMNFRRVSENDLVSGMSKICEKKGKNITKDALRVLAANADGSVRDGLSLLEQCINASGDTISRDLVLEYIGTAGDEFFINLTDAVYDGRIADALILIDKVVKDGKDTKQILKDWLVHYRNLLITKFVDNSEDLINMSTENIKILNEQSEKFGLSDINRAILLLSDMVNRSRYSTQPRILLETALITLANEETMEMVPTVAKKKKVPKAEVKKAEKAEEKKPEVKAANDDFSKVWNDIIKKATEESRSFKSMVGASCVITSLNDSKLVLEITNKSRKGYVDKARELISDKAKEVLGREVAIIIGNAPSDVNEGADSATNIANSFKQQFDVDLEVK